MFIQNRNFVLKYIKKKNIYIYIYVYIYIYIYFFFLKKLILLFSKDVLNG